MDTDTYQQNVQSQPVKQDVLLEPELQVMSHYQHKIRKKIPS